MRILLIGNGPSALAKDLGSEIDAFDGKVVRFNDFRIEGYEDKLGKRTDIWITTSAYGPHLRNNFHDVHVMTWATDRECKSHLDVKKWYPNTEKYSAKLIDKTREIMGFSAPSTGAVAVQFYEGHEIYIYGFDFFKQKIHHYSDTLEMSNTHNADKEWGYFNRLIQSGQIKQFGYDPERETMPLVRWPLPCGTDENLHWYREAAHNAWYKWFGEMSESKIVLDVGSGIGEGMEVLRQSGAKEVFGFEVDVRLKGMYDKLWIDTSGSLKAHPTNAVDVITCVDVLEHCVYDLEMMNEMKRIAREAIYITTPNYTRSMCGNVTHAREYTIAQFMNFFKPTEIWSASPDGKVHRTKLLRRLDNIIIDFSSSGPMNNIYNVPDIYIDQVPVDKRFNQTVDGMEWGHICAIFKL